MYCAEQHSSRSAEVRSGDQFQSVLDDTRGCSARARGYRYDELEPHARHVTEPSLRPGQPAPQSARSAWHVALVSHRFHHCFAAYRRAYSVSGSRQRTSVCRSGEPGPCGAQKRTTLLRGQSSRRRPRSGSWTAQWGDERIRRPTAQHAVRVSSHRMTSSRARGGCMSCVWQGCSAGHEHVRLLGGIRSMQHKLSQQPCLSGAATLAIRPHAGARTTVDFMMINPTSRMMPSVSTNHTSPTINCTTALHGASASRGR